MQRLWRMGVMLLVAGCGRASDPRSEVQGFLDGYSARYRGLYYEASKAEWRSNTHIVEGDTTNAHATRKAKEALAAFTGSAQNIERARSCLESRRGLTPLQVRQLEKILYLAADNPQTVPELVRQRIKAETEQSERLYGFDFQIGDSSVTANEIDAILAVSQEPARRLEAWEASKRVGTVLKAGLEDLRGLRNATVRALGFADYFTYQVSDYGMTTRELQDLMLQFNRAVRPLYRQLHTWARHELARRYGVEKVPQMLPAHWLPNRWGQDWGAMLRVEGLDLDAVLGAKPERWFPEQAERFYVSLGFPELPQGFWEHSDLYPLAEETRHKKNNHASAWHVDLQDDVRCLMSIVPDARWYETTHHEFGHVYYYLSYTNPEVPLLLREGANRAYHEAVGSLLGLAALQKPFLAHLGLLPADSEVDPMQQLLKEALHYVVFIPWSAGVMSEFEFELYARELPKTRFNARWWELVRRYQGIEPPAPRGEEYCDAATKTHINDDAAQYYDYAISFALLFQLHDHIARKILGQDPHATNYSGSAGVGDFLRGIMRPGGSRDWRQVLREVTGSELSARALVDYFAPLTAHLERLNAGRTHTLEDL
jgi:peptidyl-dipeptidase A